MNDDDAPEGPEPVKLNDLDGQRFANALARPEAPTSALRELFLIERLTGTHEFSDRLGAMLDAAIASRPSDRPFGRPGDHSLVCQLLDRPAKRRGLPFVCICGGSRR